MLKTVLKYGCETWTLTSCLEKNIGRFERNILRTVIGAIWDQSAHGEEEDTEEGGKKTLRSSAYNKHLHLFF
ncbi:unnamed protein product [Nezara viridula]|uniref:Uncharacterized protein n=1 Tax=Nezara viridula TaxID=85310 RepID=A0A9P0HC45_NEZVI|nr:unnamed protein product [Nezara viridula]